MKHELFRRDPSRADKLAVVCNANGTDLDSLTAAYASQYVALGLKPWQAAPCLLDPAEIGAILARGPSPSGDVHGEYAAAKLATKLLSHGLPLDCADPLAELARAKRGVR
jgi:hypothetical protein